MGVDLCVKTRQEDEGGWDVRNVAVDHGCVGRFVRGWMGESAFVALCPVNPCCGSSAFELQKVTAGDDDDDTLWLGDRSHARVCGKGTAVFGHLDVSWQGIIQAPICALTTRLHCACMCKQTVELTCSSDTLPRLAPVVRALSAANRLDGQSHADSSTSLLAAVESAGCAKQAQQQAAAVRLCESSCGISQPGSS